MDKEILMQRLKEEQEKKKQYYQICFSTDAGKEVLEDLKKRCYFEYSTFSTSDIEMAYREGLRSVYLYILNQLKPKEGGQNG